MSHSSENTKDSMLAKRYVSSGSRGKQKSHIMPKKRRSQKTIQIKRAGPLRKPNFKTLFLMLQFK